MHRDPRRRLSPTRGAYWLLGTAFLLMLAVALLAGSPQARLALAQVTTPTAVPGTSPCTPTGTSGAVTCAFTTTVGVVPGGTMSIQLTNPVGSALVGIVGPAWCTTSPTPSPGSPTAFVNLICPIASPGIQQGTTITEQVLLPSPVPNPPGGLFITQSVVYNANGPSPTGAILVNPGTCTLVPANGTGTCTVTLPTAIQPGYEGVIQIDGQVPPTNGGIVTGQTLLVDAGGAPPTLGTCLLSTPLPTSASFPSGPLTVVYGCGTAQSCAPACTITVTVRNTNGVAATPSVVAIADAPVPVPIPLPTTAEVIFSIAGGVIPTGTPITVTPTVPAAVSFCSPGVTPVPGQVCFTSNSNCVNPTGVGLPPAPAVAGAPAVSANGPYSGFIGQPLQLRGTAVPAPVAMIATCIWSFGDGSPTEHYLSPTHVYTQSGTYTATLTVTDSLGNSSSATAVVTIAAIPPLCQQPLVPSITGLSPCGGPFCPASSFNNQCRPVCPLTTETLLPNQCPGPATGNQVTINGPLQALVSQAVTINANINLPSTSQLLIGDYLRFDFGDGAVITNTAPCAFVPGAGLAGGCAPPSGSATATPTAGVTITTAPVAASATPGPLLCYDGNVSTVGAHGCDNDGGLLPGQPALPGAAFPASTQASHAYSQPGTYNVTVSVTFSDGTTSVARTTVTVGGQPASLPSAPVNAPPVLATSVSLNSGCNSVTLTFPNGTPISTVAAAVQGTTLIAIYQTPANAPELVYYADPSQTSNLAAVQHGDQVSICVQGAGSLVQPAS